MPKVGKNNWAKTMENIVMYLKLVRGMRRTPLTYVVRHHVKVAHITPGSYAYLNLDEEMIARTSIVNASSNLRMNQDSLDRVYADHQADTFKIDKAMVYQILSKMFADIDAFVYMKQRKAMQDGQAVFFDVHRNLHL